MGVFISLLSGAAQRLHTGGLGKTQRVCEEIKMCGGSSPPVLQADRKNVLWEVFGDVVSCRKMSANQPTLPVVLLYALCVGAGFGCPLPKEACRTDSDCPKNSRCFKKGDFGVCAWNAQCPEGSVLASKGLCIWGKLSEESPLRVVPDIRFVELGGLEAQEKTAKPSLTFQVDIYGAVEVETQFEMPGLGKQPLSCTRQETGRAEEEHRRLQCATEAEEEGAYALQVEARSEEDSAAETFAWTYEKRLLQVHMLLEEKGEGTWLRDDILHLQLQSAEEVDWTKTELFVGARQALPEACQASAGFFPASNAACFYVPLSEFPDLLHGPYRLELKATSVDKAGNHAIKSQDVDIQISRRLWTLEWDSYYPSESGVVTREGLLLVVLQVPASSGAEDRLVAINANGKPEWPNRNITNITNPYVLLGRHRSADLVVAGCGNAGGLKIINAKTGNFWPECANPVAGSQEHMALLQGGNNKDLVVVRRIYLLSIPRTYALEACRLAGEAFVCERSPTLPNAGSYSSFASLTRDHIVVRQTPEGAARVFVGSLERHWCALEWRDGEGWVRGSDGSACVEQGPDATELGLAEAKVQRLSAHRLWNYDGIAFDNYWLSIFNSEDKTSTDIKGVQVVLVDAGDDSLVKNSKLQLMKFSATGELLHQRTQSCAYCPLALMEGGRLISSGESTGVSCIEPNLSDCWAESAAAESNGWLLGILPQSATRSVAIFGYKDMRLSKGYIEGILLDSPGLKKDAPWPMLGHDLCRTNNASVPIDNCWDGPQ